MPQEEVQETAIEHHDDFGHSVHRLFELATNVPEDVYYKVLWDEERPGNVVEVMTMRGTATGARKQEQRGAFSQAQFKLTETSDVDDSESQRFIWLQIGFQTPGTTIEFNEENLKHDTGYHPLSSHDVTLELASHVVTLDDYANLINEMSQRKIAFPPELMTHSDKLVRRMTYQPLDSDTGISPSSLFEFIRVLEPIDAELTKHVQSRLLSKLLGAVGRYGSTQAIQDEAASALERAVQQGVIPDEPRLINRILGSHHVYKYPFATEMLHSRLSTVYGRAGARSVFSVERTAFASDYMAMVLRGRLRSGDGSDEARQLVGGFLKNNPIMRFNAERKIAPFDSLLHLASHFGDQPEVDEEVNEEANDAVILRSADLPVETLVGVGRAFGEILHELQSSDPEIATSQEEFDQKCVEIVEAVLQSLIQRKIAKKAIETANKERSKKP